MGDDERSLLTDLVSDALANLESLNEHAHQLVIAIHALRWEAAIARLAADPERLAAAKPDIAPGCRVQLRLPALLRGGEAGDPDHVVRGDVLDRDERRIWVRVLMRKSYGGFQDWHHPVADVELL